jgi:hypothetical protein
MNIISGAASALIFAGFSFAATIDIYSHAGLTVIPKGGTPGLTVEIQPHSAWAPEVSGGAQWISYQQTGVTPGTSVSGDYAHPAMQVFHTFNVGGPGFLNLTVWADDTAGVFLDDVLLPSTFSHPNFSQNVCADGPIGCQPGEGGAFNDIAFGAGTHTLRFDVYQLSSNTSQPANPFGLLYTGTAETAPVPEPGTYALLGIGLIGFAAVRRRFFRR